MQLDLPLLSDASLVRPSATLFRFRRRRPISLRLANCAGDIIVQRVYAQTQRALSIPVTLMFRWDDCSTRPVRVKAQDRRLYVLSEARG
ncbi:unnamed protein product, partial [Brenthis ino]